MWPDARQDAKKDSLFAYMAGKCSRFTIGLFLGCATSFWCKRLWWTLTALWQGMHSSICQILSILIDLYWRLDLVARDPPLDVCTTAVVLVGNGRNIAIFYRCALQRILQILRIFPRLTISIDCYGRCSISSSHGSATVRTTVLYNRRSADSVKYSGAKFPCKFYTVRLFSLNIPSNSKTCYELRFRHSTIPNGTDMLQNLQPSKSAFALHSLEAFEQ